MTVDELLVRMTGADAVPDHAVRHRLHPGNRAGLAGGREKRSTRDVLRLSVGAAAVVAAVCATAIAATPKPSSPEPVAAPPLSLQPPAPTFADTPPAPPASASATSPVTFTAVPVSTPAPEPPRPAAPTTASVVPVPVRAASCTVRFTITDSWPGGFTASVGITNTGSSAVSPWTLTWTFTAGQQVTHGWDGEYTQSGDRVTVHPASYNPAIAASATTNIGFNGSYAATNPAPTGFALNGTPCRH
ncbi:MULTISPECIES: cellulose-binding domain-containing protein [Amycolatopsis]|uniref:cellulose-binding domain-containing protein n=1 Tax=Amycolatopsis TaxID=1813 RepID=UPI001E3B5D06|nr:cellulose-binding domain-containing protein [Amycolatopsis bullii]